MTVYDNLAFVLRNCKLAESAIKTEIDRAATILGLAELMQRRPKQLSGGHQQRVAQGRCIVRNPKVFLFDEPLSNLNAKLRTQMRLEIKRLRYRVPTTSVFVTHDQVEVMTLGDRVVIMKECRIQQAGTPLEGYGRPANKFLAGSIGAPSMNFVLTMLREDGGQFFAESAGMRLPVSPAHLPVLRAWRNRPVILGVRPEHLVLCDAGVAGSFAVRVEVTEQLGSEIVLESTLDELTISVSCIDPTITLQRDEVVHLRVDPGRLHFFNPNDETSILTGVHK